MRYVRTFGRFWYDFIVGDDWRLAVGVVAVLGAGFLAAHHGLDAWWSLPVVVSLVLGASITQAVRRAAAGPAPAAADPPVSPGS